MKDLLSNIGAGGGAPVAGAPSAAAAGGAAAAAEAPKEEEKKEEEKEESDDDMVCWIFVSFVERNCVLTHGDFRVSVFSIKRIFVFFYFFLHRIHVTPHPSLACIRSMCSTHCAYTQKNAQSQSVCELLSEREKRSCFVIISIYGDVLCFIFMPSDRPRVVLFQYLSTVVVSGSSL